MRLVERWLQGDTEKIIEPPDWETNNKEWMDCYGVTFVKQDRDNYIYTRENGDIIIYNPVTHEFRFKAIDDSWQKKLFNWQ